MFNTCSRGRIHRSLTNIGKGYNLVGISFPHTTLRPSQLMVSYFYLRAPPGLYFNQVLPTKSKFEFKELIAAPWSFHHSVIYRSLHLRLAIANDLSQTIGFTRIDQKIILIQLGQQFNSYNLMHIPRSNIKQNFNIRDKGIG
jgi:hypothetical protein